MEQRMRVWAFFGIVACWWLPSIAKAQSVNDTITDWGLLGTWATDCGKPAKDAGRLIYVIRRGKPVHLRDFGDRKDEAEILTATVAPDSSLELRIRYLDLEETRDLAFVRGADQRIQAKYNRPLNGAYSIVDSKIVATGAPAAWQTRCDGAGRP
jgi:hypothetical protein